MANQSGNKLHPQGNSSGVRRRTLRSPRPRYDRLRDLPKLVPLWPKQLADVTIEGRERVLSLLRRALKSERRRGLGGHWTYDLARHAQLLAAYQVEQTELSGLKKTKDRRRVMRTPVLVNSTGL